MTHAALTLRSPRVYLAVLAVTLGTIALALVAEAPISRLEFGLLIGSVALLGIPHGAVDHLVAEVVYGLRRTWRDQALFYGFYLLAMLVYGALWVFFPVPCLLLFLVFAVYHFGQADLAYLDAPGALRYALYVSRGLLLIGVPIFAHLGVVAPIFERIAGFDLLAAGALVAYQTILVVGLIGQHVVLFGLAAGGPLQGRAGLGREALNIVVLAVLFLVVNPLVAFAVYFGFWHSLGHILELVRFFNRNGRPMSVLGFYRRAALYTLVSFLGLGGLYFLNRAFGLQEHMIALLFILISVLTLPHMVIVEKFYQETGGGEQEPGGSRPERKGKTAISPAP